MFGKALAAFGGRAEVQAASLPAGGGVSCQAAWVFGEVQAEVHVSAQGTTVHMPTSECAETLGGANPKRNQVQPMPQAQVLQQVPQPRQHVYQVGQQPQPQQQPARVPTPQEGHHAAAAESCGKIMFFLGFIFPPLALYVAIIKAIISLSLHLVLLSGVLAPDSCGKRGLVVLA